VDSFKKEDKKMKITSAVTATVFLLSHIVGVSEGVNPKTFRRFNGSAANEIKDVDITAMHRYVAAAAFCGHLAYIAENRMKVEVDSIAKKNELMRGLKIQEKFISSRIKALENQFADIQQKTPLNFLDHKNIDTEREVNLADRQRLSSQLNDIRTFLNYCSETECIFDPTATKATEESTSGQIVNPA
jgi:hypothetical protein